MVFLTSSIIVEYLAYSSDEVEISREGASALLRNFLHLDYTVLQGKRETFREVAHKVTEVATKATESSAEQWQRQEARSLPCDVARLYEVPGKILVIGPLLGKGVTRDVHTGAEIVSGKADAFSDEPFASKTTATRDGACYS